MDAESAPPDMHMAQHSDQQSLSLNTLVCMTAVVQFAGGGLLEERTGFRHPVTPLRIFIFRFSPARFPTSTPRLCMLTQALRQCYRLHTAKSTNLAARRPLALALSYQCKTFEAVAD